MHWNFCGVQYHARLKQTFLHAQNRCVFAKQGNSMGHGQVDEFLIVWVFACAGRFGCWLGHHLDLAMRLTMCG